MSSSVQFNCSVVSDSLRPHELKHARPHCPSPTPGVHSDTSIELVMQSSHLILCRPLHLLPQIPPSIRVFSNESTLCMRGPKYWNFSFGISPSNEHPEIKLPTSAGSWKNQESSRKTSISALLTTPKPLTVWITVNCEKF